ncbi:MAG: glutathione synthase, partial [Gammaproteobacteria bacterium]
MPKLGVVMDPIGSIDIKKDTTFAMLLEAQRRGWSLFYMEQGDLFLEGGEACAALAPLEVQEHPR